MILAGALIFAGLVLVPLAVVSKPAETVLLLLVALAAYVALARAGNLAGVFRQPWLWTLLAVVAWGAASAAWAVVPLDALRLAPAIAALFVASAVWFFAAGTLDAAHRVTAVRYAGIGFVAGASLLVVELVAGLPIANVVRGLPRPGADVLEISLLNSAVTVLVLALWPLLGFWWARPARAILLVLATAAVLALADSEAGVVAFAVAAFSFVAVLFGGRGAALALAGLAAGFVLLAPVASGALDPARFAPALEESAPSTLHRLYVWHYTATQVWARPATGWGLDSARAATGESVEGVEAGLLVTQHPHNAALQVWMELGPIGALLFAAFLLQVGRAVANLDGAARAGAAATFSAALVFAFVSFGIWQSWWLAALALTAALARTAQPPESAR
jgi:O-antigen ligase